MFICGWFYFNRLMKNWKQECIYTFDGSFNGFLTVIFRAFEDKRQPEAIISLRESSQLPMGEIVDVATCPEKSTRVRKGIVERSDNKNLRLVHVAFLSGSPESRMLLWRYLQKLFRDESGDFYRNLLDEDVYTLVQEARKVRREAHRFQGFVRFQRTRDDMYAAAIDPDNDVVKLLAPHFRARFPDRHWLIYDTRRNYGIYYDLHCVQEVKMADQPFALDSGQIKKHAQSLDEDYYRTLWQHYYDAINIMERKNHRQMRGSMPKRYWKYLPEKNY